MSLVKYKPNNIMSVMDNPFKNIAKILDDTLAPFHDRQWTSTYLDETIYGFRDGIDMIEHDLNYEIQMDIPGLGIDDLSVFIKENTLNVTGEKTVEPIAEGSTYLRRGRVTTRVNKVVSLPDDSNIDKVSASMQDGVLKVLVPKTKGKKDNRKIIKVKKE